jgi:hypothetical protein
MEMKSAWQIWVEDMKAKLPEKQYQELRNTFREEFEEIGA